MFADAYEKASQFTHPVVVSCRYFDGTVQCSVGAYILLNTEGWALSAAHVLSVVPAYNKHQDEIRRYRESVKVIEGNTKLNKKQVDRQIRRLKSNPKWVTNYSFWWGRNQVQHKDLKVFPDADLITVRLEGIDFDAITHYPVFKDPTKSMRVGTSLCKLGYPFHRIEATFDESKGTFELAPSALPIPLFPIEGIYTRDCLAGKTQDGKKDIKLIETSSPGLRGQSGGPIFDVNATVWGIQSRTTHFPLGFSPEIQKGNKTVEENQFLNVGLGVHPELITTFMKDHGIDISISDY